MVDKELLSRKLSRVRSYIDVLKQSEDITWERGFHEYVTIMTKEVKNEFYKEGTNRILR
jgi:hypothetical protein